MNTNDEKYMKTQKSRIGEVAKGMLDGSIHYLKGAAELESLRHDIGAYANDPDFMPFVAVVMEINSLPIGSSPQYWTEEDLSRHDSEIQESIKWAKEFSLVQCKSLAERFGCK